MSDIFRPQWALDDKPPDFSSVVPEASTSLMAGDPGER
jgi:hypothetical protein